MFTIFVRPYKISKNKFEFHRNFNFIAIRFFLPLEVGNLSKFPARKVKRLGKLKRFLRVLAESMGDLRGESKKRARYKGWREGDGEEKGGPRKIDTLNRFAGG